MSNTVTPINDKAGTLTQYRWGFHVFKDKAIVRIDLPDERWFEQTFTHKEFRRIMWTYFKTWVQRKIFGNHP